MTKSEIVLKAKEYAETSRLIIDEHTKIIDKQSFIAGANHVLARAEKLAEALDITDLKMREIRLYLSHKEMSDTNCAVMNLLASAIQRSEQALKEWSKP